MTKNDRAAQMWSLLVLAARNQQILSYALVQKLTGIPKQGVGRFLDPIQSYCKRNKLPPLTSLIVNEVTGMPSHGFTEATEKEMLGAQARVFVYDWFSQNAPSTKDFSK
jgi:hypothetical protein